MLPFARTAPGDAGVPQCYSQNDKLRRPRLQGDTYSFVVRIWHEALDSDGSIIVWRGSIDHVGSGERDHFDDLGQMLQFIQEQVGLDGRRSRSPANVKVEMEPV